MPDDPIASAARRVADAIEINRNRASGKPVIRGTRFTVAQMLAELADGPGPADLARQFPTLNADAIRAVLGQLAASPVLDAVAAGQEDVGRIDRMVRAFRDERKRSETAARCGMCEPDDCFCGDRALARAAMALADAERAAVLEHARVDSSAVE